MYIKKEDFSYFENLYKVLDEATKKRFLDILRRSVSKKAGTEISRIQVVGDEIYDVRGIEEGEMITRTLIKKAYREAKGVTGERS
jgi:hypothetical protein